MHRSLLKGARCCDHETRMWLGLRGLLPASREFWRRAARFGALAPAVGAGANFATFAAIHAKANPSACGRVYLQGSLQGSYGSRSPASGDHSVERKCPVTMYGMVMTSAPS
jgi:hypothetical protein